MPIGPAFAQADDQAQAEPATDGDGEAVTPGSITVSLVSDPPAADITLAVLRAGLQPRIPIQLLRGS